MGGTAALAGMVFIVRVVTRIRTTIKVDKIKDLAASIAALSDRRVMVGFPKETSERGEGDEISNAELGYIHNYGAPEANIPQREFMEPGIASIQDALIEGLKQAAIAALTSDVPVSRNAGIPALDKWLHRIGLQAQAAIKNTIRAGLSPELAEATVAARIARRKSKAWRRKRWDMVNANIAAGKAPGAGIFTPLIDTAAMLNAITYVIRIPSTDTTLLIGPTPGRTEG